MSKLASAPWWSWAFFLMFLPTLVVGQPVAPAALEAVSERGATIDEPELPALTVAARPSLPVSLEGAFVGVHDGVVLVAGGRTAEGDLNSQIYAFLPESDAWTVAGSLATPRADGATINSGTGVLLIGGRAASGPSAEVVELQWTGDEVVAVDRPSLSRPRIAPAVTSVGRTVHVIGGAPAGEATTIESLDLDAPAAGWQQTLTWPGPALTEAAAASLQDTLFVFGRAVDGEPVGYRHTALQGWEPTAAPGRWPDNPVATAYGQSHVFVFGAPLEDADHPTALAYHTITNRWLRIPSIATALPVPPRIVGMGQQMLLVTGDVVQAVEPEPVQTNYGWFDHTVVAIYLAGMVGIGWYFARRENSTGDFFRGGQRLPWWASGMSLFATFASAISLMAMPGMSFANNWTYFSISVCSVIALPINVFLMAPLVRRLQIATAYEYLERRFGLFARLAGSIIFMFTQMFARIGSITLLPAIALQAITGIDVVYCILLMGGITIAYTYLGGLEAVIWTDTIQGFVMVITVAACLVLVLFKLDMVPSEMWALLGENRKLHTFDFEFSLLYPTIWIFFLSTVVTTMGSIGDQNFVQRVQCTPDLKQARLAVVTQMAVAVPINVLLFSLGTALWLFYYVHPGSLNPVMKVDGVFPFFAAQQLPVGVSGLVVAALLAATMSSVSSSICSVSDLGVNDFYRRFKPDASDRSCLLLGRLFTALAGIIGMAAAILMAKSTIVSVWDMAILVTGLISNGILGLYLLGLLTKRTHEPGALLGVAAGMAVVIALRVYTPVTFWIYGFVGTIVTLIVGYVASLIIPSSPRQLEGLTIFTLPRDEYLPAEAQAGAAHTEETAGLANG